MNIDLFIKSVESLGINVTGDALAKLEKYYFELVEYNKHTNITRILKKEDVYLKHFYDSLTIVKIIDANNINTLLDIGSGGGFPGLVLKIFFPQIEVYLLDSNNKKVKFLEYISKTLDLKVNLINDRCENYQKENPKAFDLVTARAVTNIMKLVELSEPLLKEEGRLVAFKGDLDRERENIKKLKQRQNIHINTEEFLLPVENSKRSFIKISFKN